jgi:hypothetical protein
MPELNINFSCFSGIYTVDMPDVLPEVSSQVVSRWPGPEELSSILLKERSHTGLAVTIHNSQKVVFPPKSSRHLLFLPYQPKVQHFVAIMPALSLAHQSFSTFHGNTTAIPAEITSHIIKYADTHPSVACSVSQNGLGKATLVYSVSVSGRLPGRDWKVIKVACGFTADCRPRDLGALHTLHKFLSAKLSIRNPSPTHHRQPLFVIQ